MLPKKVLYEWDNVGHKFLENLEEFVSKNLLILLRANCVTGHGYNLQPTKKHEKLEILHQRYTNFKTNLIDPLIIK